MSAEDGSSGVASPPAAGDDRRSFTDLFIHRPVLASVISLLIFLLGLLAYTHLPTRQFPKLTNTEITITTTYPGADPALMQGFITTPIQQAVAGTSGIDYMVSSNTQGTSTITIYLKLDADGDAALTDVLAKVEQTRNVIPREANDPVVVKQTGQAIALMYLSFESREMSEAQITDYLTRVVQPQIQAVGGVGSAMIMGGQPFAMRVWLNPERMAALAVTPADVQNAIQANNFTTAPGQVKDDFTVINISAATDLTSAEAFRELVVASRDGTLIRLGDIAEVELGPEEVTSSAVANGLPAVFIAIFVTPESNPLDVITNVKKLLPAIESRLPASLELTIGYDATVFIRESIHEVLRTIGAAALIVVIVIFLFLGNLRSTVIPIVTIPLSLIGVMLVLLFLGYSLNLLTLLAFVLAIGLVVDDAIVVVENIHRNIEEGLAPFDAAIKGAREIKAPVITMAITLAAVYAPIGFVSGLTGTLFREFAFTLAGAVIISGIIALTLSPMMCSKLLLSEKSTSPFVRFLDRAFNRLRTVYERRLDAVFDARPVVLMVVFVVLGGCVFLYMTTKKELAPIEDQAVIISNVKAPQYANLDYLEKFTKQVGDVYKSFPEFLNFFVINGMPDVNQGQAGLILKPWNERKRSELQVMAALQPKLNQIAGIQAFAFPLPSLPGSAGPPGPAVQFVITTIADYQTLFSVLEKIQTAAQQSGLFAFVDSDLKFDNPQVDIGIDRSKANALGINMEDIGSTLATMLGGNYVNRVNMFGRSYEVIPQVPRDFRLTREMLGQYYIRTGSGEIVPLSSVVTIGESVTPNALTTFQQLNSATIMAALAEGRSLGEALAFLEDKANEVFPVGFAYDFQGESRQFVQEGETLAIAFVFAVIVIFLVLAAQYESYR
ncbi:MAG: efflux RND transporter permease subunit, partial [Alphaproteobacteria bacterium]|nr:efflux RND transporter permease subunit [Alphaproteobacteria bacterium]